jgi:uncharacterized membrane protein
MNRLSGDFFTHCMLSMAAQSSGLITHSASPSRFNKLIPPSAPYTKVATAGIPFAKELSGLST